MSTPHADLDTRFRIVRIVGWFRWVLGVIAAVAVSLVIVSATTIENNRDGCVRAARRANDVALNWEVAAGVRRSQGDYATAAKYEKNIIDMRSTIAMPKGWKGDPAKRGVSPQNRVDGCNDVYPLLIPFVD